MKFTSTTEEESINPKDIIGRKKPPLELVPSVGIIHEAMAFKDGAKKYGPYNWRMKKVSAMVYIGAMRRHLAAYLDGESHAEDSGVHHLGHLRACANIILDAMHLGKLVDDRPLPGATSAVIADYTDGETTSK
jgi:hypothetical protein